MFRILMWIDPASSKFITLGKWYAATIVSSFDNGKYKVKYTQFNSEHILSKECIREKAAAAGGFTVGATVEAICQGMFGQLCK